MSRVESPVVQAVGDIGAEVHNLHQAFPDWHFVVAKNETVHPNFHLKVGAVCPNNVDPQWDWVEHQVKGRLSVKLLNTLCPLEPVGAVSLSVEDPVVLKQGAPDNEALIQGFQMMDQSDDWQIVWSSKGEREAFDINREVAYRQMLSDLPAQPEIQPLAAAKRQSRFSLSRVLEKAQSGLSKVSNAWEDLKEIGGFLKEAFLNPPPLPRERPQKYHPKGVPSGTLALLAIGGLAGGLEAYQMLHHPEGSPIPGARLRAGEIEYIQLADGRTEKQTTYYAQNVPTAVAQAAELLQPNGRIVDVSYHDLPDGSRERRTIVYAQRPALEQPESVAGIAVSRQIPEAVQPADYTPVTDKSERLAALQDDQTTGVEQWIMTPIEKPAGMSWRGALLNSIHVENSWVDQKTGKTKSQIIAEATERILASKFKMDESCMLESILDCRTNEADQVNLFSTFDIDELNYLLELDKAADAQAAAQVKLRPYLDDPHYQRELAAVDGETDQAASGQLAGGRSAGLVQ